MFNAHALLAPPGLGTRGYGVEGYLKALVL